MILLKIFRWLLLLLILGVLYITFTHSYKKPLLEGRLQHYNTGQKVIALTFDDGPVDATRDILALLAEVDVKATFFVIGEESQKRPDILKNIYSAGHTVGNHTWNHPHALGLRSKTFIESQIDQTDAIIKDAIGISPKYVRAPFGESTPYSDYILNTKGMTSVHWTISLRDYKNFSPEILKEKMNDIQKSEVLLLHDRAYADPAIRQALKESILNLKARGFTFITIDELY